jgi:hypothetical protein
MHLDMSVSATDDGVTTSSVTDADRLERVRELRAAGRSPKEIARALGVRPSVAAQLVREVARQAAEAAPEPAVVGCWVSEGWSAGLTVAGDHDWPDRSREDGESGLAMVAVARRHKPQRVSVCGYLVDTYCLGVKNALGPEIMNERDLPAFLGRYYSAIQPDTPAIEAPLELARHLVWGAVDYARGLGFEPHPDFAATAGHLGSWDEKSAITFGRDGRPFFVQGPHDNPRAVIRTLTASVGEGNFDVLLGGPVGSVL